MCCQQRWSPRVPSGSSHILVGSGRAQALLRTCMSLKRLEYMHATIRPSMCAVNCCQRKQLTVEPYVALCITTQEDHVIKDIERRISVVTHLPEVRAKGVGAVDPATEAWSAWAGRAWDVMGSMPLSLLRPLGEARSRQSTHGW